MQIHELQDALAELQIYAKPATIQALFNSLDHDGNGTIEYPELFKVLGRRDQPNDQGLSKGHVHSKASPQVPAIRSMLQSRNSAGKASRTAKLADGSDVHSTSAYPHLRYLCDFCEGDSDERSIKTTVALRFEFQPHQFHPQPAKLHPVTQTPTLLTSNPDLSGALPLTRQGRRLLCKVPRSSGAGARASQLRACVRHERKARGNGWGSSDSGGRRVSQQGQL